MRCLRCALDYPQGVQYCDRCGRRLSQPPGTKADRDELAAAQDNSFLYSTFAPPAAHDAGLDAIHYATPVQQDFGHMRAAPLADAYGDAEQAVAVEGLDEWRRNPEPSAAPAADEDWDDDPITSAIARLRSSLSQPAEEEQAVSSAALRRAGLDTAIRSGHRPAFGAIFRILATSPKVLAGVVVAIVVVVLGVLVLQRHTSYTNDLQQAQALQAARQYTGALALYRRAEGEWPLHGDVTTGVAAIQAQLAADQAAAAAAQAGAQAHVATELARKSMYQAKMAERRLAAQQPSTTNGATQP